jgi:hypothetical protein
MEAIASLILAVMLLALTVALRIMFSAIFAFPLYWAWNESMVLFGLPPLDWVSSFCLLVVAAILLPSPASQSSKK